MFFLMPVYKFTVVGTLIQIGVDKSLEGVAKVLRANHDYHKEMKSMVFDNTLKNHERYRYMLKRNLSDKALDPAVWVNSHLTQAALIEKEVAILPGVLVGEIERDKISNAVSSANEAKIAPLEKAHSVAINAGLNNCADSIKTLTKLSSQEEIIAAMKTCE